MPADEYSTISGGGKLKLKGVKDGRVDKTKKKKKKHHKPQEEGAAVSAGEETRAESTEAAAETGQEDVSKEVALGAQSDGRKLNEEISDSGEKRVVYKTEAERKYEEQRKKRLNDRLRREGVKTHKERVEELNRYLSTLSEHHDMPKIGPG
ncbi:conserved hypothetical protein [Talaromyces stipitatus ATCC 10500]|uniref:DUF1754-domain-containing protein n=1 Tax=Talaromyces stipitatus (strain ATCC 10500 / CBS 375.48 / QM 6759 / NRRL 1006) TaxID=441959 RepID=B8M256_TALSN|nr:uncharacterized protein TSTA_087560 [Talaromyces stipitatus ATCC 10500]EED21520.1 conserved hypothetical protein [Talaromyces stipitatus ATCC 10500]